MGRSSVCAFTLARCHRLSSSTRCFTATCAAGCRCCILQPPQAPVCRPKCGQPGRTRCELSRASADIWPASQLFFLRDTLTRTRSPGKAPSMKTTLPCPSASASPFSSTLARWATPCASRSSDSTSNQSSPEVMRRAAWPPQERLRSHGRLRTKRAWK